MTKLTFSSEEEVYKYHLEDKDNRQVVIFDGVVYDVQEYAPNHPGGDHYILDLLGKNIENAFEENEHSKSAKNTLKGLPVVGTIKSDDNASTSSQGSNKDSTNTFGDATSMYGIKFNEKVNSRLNFDYTKPLFVQIYNADFTFDEYVTYINEPKHFVNPVRDLVLFDNAFLEAVSQAPWWHVPTGMIPYWTWCMYNMYYVNFSFSPLAIIAVFFFGLFSWTLLEYILHKYLFHGEDFWMKHMPHNKYLFTAHFFTHGIHHAFPQDRYRIVFPPVPGNLFIFYPFVYRGIKALIPEEYFFNFFLGLTVGYTIYEMIHFSLHHCSPKSEYLRNLKLYHMQHHYKFGTVGFGVSSKFWDVVFKTEIDMNNKTRKNL